jgi:hypothetical protein
MEGQTFKIHFRRIAATAGNMAYRANGETGLCFANKVN